MEMSFNTISNGGLYDSIRGIGTISFIYALREEVCK